MGAVISLAPDGNQDTRWLARFEDRHHLVGLGVLKVVQNKFVRSTIVSVTFWRLQNRSAPLFGPVLDPVLKPIVRKHVKITFTNETEKDLPLMTYQITY